MICILNTNVSQRTSIDFEGSFAILTAKLQCPRRDYITEVDTLKEELLIAIEKQQAADAVIVVDASLVEIKEMLAKLTSSMADASFQDRILRQLVFEEINLRPSSIQDPSGVSLGCMLNDSQNDRRRISRQGS